MNCCDEYGDCRQGRDCPARVAKVGNRMHAKNPLRGPSWRMYLKHLARSMLIVLAVLLVTGIAVGVMR